MQHLRERFGETVGLAVLDARKRQGLIVGALQGNRHRFSFTLTPGTWFPPHTGAPAKAMLAALPAERQRDWLGAIALPRYTRQTITTKAAFRRELAAIAARGYALDRSEEVEGCHCVAAPVVDASGRPVAAVWITGPSSRLSLKQLRAHAPAVREAAAQIAHALFASPAAGSPPPAGAALVQRAVHHLQAHLSEPADWRALASAFGVSYSTLRHVFAKQTGVPPARYHLSLRLDEAKRLLRETALPVLAVAEQAGFSDPNHFSALFARKAGCSPTRFRAAQLPPDGRPQPSSPGLSRHSASASAAAKVTQSR
jgi:AraC-like DNA-binding protein